MPKSEITDSAFKTHKLTKEILKEKGAKELDRKELERLSNFLNEEKDLPIIAHNAEYDRDDVLEPALNKLLINKSMLQHERWECTIDLAKRRTDLVPSYIKKGLDSLLSYFHLGARDPKAPHDALIDC